MKPAGKKFLTVIIIAASLISLLSVSSLGAVIANKSDYNCTSARLQSIIDKYSGTYWNGSFGGARKCKGFADKIFNEMYGNGGIGQYNQNGNHYYIPNPVKAVEVGRYDRKASFEELASLMKKAHSGDYVQWSRGYSQHSAIFVSCDDNGMYIFDCNYISPNKCGVHYVTFSKLAAKNVGISVYNSTSSETPIQATAPKQEAKIQPEPEKEKLKVVSEDLKLEYQETCDIKTTGDYNVTVWESSDTTVAIVTDSGKVIGVGNGTAVIFATDESGTIDACNVEVHYSEHKELMDSVFTGFDFNEILLAGALAS
ncbi:MAG: hypothetical protein PUB20_08105 [Clostridia bacterium]|nr:hypothetical protein [Clostridia bacterium]